VTDKPVLEPQDARALASRVKCRTPERMAFRAYGSGSATCGGCASYCGVPRALFKAPKKELKQAELL